MEKNIRTRYAPSPTGLLHIGNARSALFSYIFAKKNNGSFVLRIEDTDKERSKKEYENIILEDLKWLGINWDEGPYRQSEREDLYKKYIERLLTENKAYYCYCSPDELEAQRQDQMSRGIAPKYNRTCSNKPLDKSKPYVIRLRVMDNKKIKFNDIIRGNIEVNSDTIGDIVIAKNETTPLYNLAVVIDDYEMNITHVIRGEDHIPNTPKQILIAEALGIEHPKYAHLPLVLGTDKSKLSKRHGAVSVTEYKNMGYLPEAMVNFMAYLGWNPGTEREIYEMEDLIKDFSIEKIQKSGAVFNIQKLDHINAYYIRKKDIAELTKLCLPYLENIKIKEDKYYLESGEEVTIEYIQKSIAIYQERMKKLSEINELSDHMFKEINYDKELLRWKNMTDEELSQSLDIIINTLHKIDNWNLENLEKEIINEAEKTGDRGSILWPMRVALSGKKASAGPLEIANVLGKEKTIKLIKNAKKKI